MPRITVIDELNVLEYFSTTAKFPNPFENSNWPLKDDLIHLYKTPKTIKIPIKIEIDIPESLKKLIVNPMFMPRLSDVSARTMAMKAKELERQMFQYESEEKRLDPRLKSPQEQRCQFIKDLVANFVSTSAAPAVNRACKSEIDILASRDKDLSKISRNEAIHVILTVLAVGGAIVGGVALGIAAPPAGAAAIIGTVFYGIGTARLVLEISQELYDGMKTVQDQAKVLAKSLNSLIEKYQIKPQGAPPEQKLPSMPQAAKPQGAPPELKLPSMPQAAKPQGAPPELKLPSMPQVAKPQGVPQGKPVSGKVDHFLMGNVKSMDPETGEYNTGDVKISFDPKQTFEVNTAREKLISVANAFTVIPVAPPNIARSMVECDKWHTSLMELYQKTGKRTKDVDTLLNEAENLVKIKDDDSDATKVMKETMKTHFYTRGKQKTPEGQVVDAVSAHEMEGYGKRDLYKDAQGKKEKKLAKLEQQIDELVRLIPSLYTKCEAALKAEAEIKGIINDIGKNKWESLSRFDKLAQFFVNVGLLIGGAASGGVQMAKGPSILEKFDFGFNTSLSTLQEIEEGWDIHNGISGGRRGVNQ